VIEPLRFTFVVACGTDHAFNTWTERAAAWWPRQHTMAQEEVAEIVFEPHVGGRIFERTRAGGENEWGEVTIYDRPRRIAYLWFIAADRSDATEVEIRFVEVGARQTRVEIEHRGWERLGPERGPAWRDVNQGGWDGVLPCYLAACASAASANPSGGQLMATSVGTGTQESPWQLKTPPGTSEYQMWRDETADPPALVCQVGGTQLRYHLRCIDDLHQMLKLHGDWMPLGGADEQKPAPDGSVEAWGRSGDNPVGGWYGLKKGLRGRFGVYVPPLLEALGLAELEHNPRNNRMRAL
jgi:hypothetical protein